MVPRRHQRLGPLLPLDERDGSLMGGKRARELGLARVQVPDADRLVLEGEGDLLASGIDRRGNDIDGGVHLQFTAELARACIDDPLGAR